MSSDPRKEHAALLRAGLSSMVGRRIGAYEIQAVLGAGGMGEVYRARDTRLDRDVAIKFLHAEFLDDADFRERFNREARTISTLDHPGICAVYDVGEFEHEPYLVMQYINGETLASRLQKGALPFDLALRIAIDVASALDAAHRNGVVHRDLKPGNVMLARAGSGKFTVPQAKLLDFGLAKITPPVLGGPPGSTRTATPPLTTPGTIIGTLQYMAPEQLEEQPIDVRTDVWAFGCVLYEMLTGHLAFKGETRAALIGAILKEEPPVVSRLQPAAPPLLDRVVATCLSKNPNDRFQSVHDLLLQLRWIVDGGSGVGVAAPIVHRRRWRARLSWMAIAILALWGATATYLTTQSWRRESQLNRPVHFGFGPPEGGQFWGSAISPDGTRIVFIAADTRGQNHLWIRPLDGLTAQVLPGTEGVIQVFWSPDSASLGFLTESTLQRVDLSAGSPKLLANVNLPGGGTWNRNGIILFSPNRANGPLARISADGGAYTPETIVDSSRGETNHRLPEFLPDGRHYLFCITKGGTAEVAFAELGSKTITHLFTADTMPRYAAPGFLLTLRRGTILAQAFDAGSGTLSGDPFFVMEHVGFDGRLADFSVSETGILVAGEPKSNMTQPTWVDRGGKPMSEVGTPGDYRGVSISPDESRVAFARSNPETGADDIWVLDVARNAWSRVTADFRQATTPLWSPDGGALMFMANQAGRDFGVYQKSISGTDSDHPLFGPIYWIEDWSRDGQQALYIVNNPETGLDLYVRPVAPGNIDKPRPIVATKYVERDGRFSPDGRWVAYTSTETGRPELYVQSLLAKGNRWSLSSTGARQPSWRSDGLELYYIAPGESGDTLMAVGLRAGSVLNPGMAHPLFPIPMTFPGLIRDYVAGKGGQRFLVMMPAKDPKPAMVTVLVNWLAAARH